MTVTHQRLTRTAALLSFGAAAVHALVTQDHFEEWWGYGAFFMIASAVQVLYGFLLLANGPPGTPVPVVFKVETWMRRRRGLFLLGIWGNGAIIALYLVTRTVGVPLLGPEAGEVEGVGVVDLLSKVFEAALIGCLWVLLREDHPGAVETNPLVVPT